MQHLISKGNLGLITVKSTSKDWKHIFVTEKPSDGHSISDRSYVFPLYIDKKANFTKEFEKLIVKKYSSLPKPEEIFGYIYAILNSSKYQEKYNGFLKRDFPRIKLTNDFKRFKLMSKLGLKLVGTHLLKKGYENSELAKFPINGTNELSKIKYDKKKRLLFINKDQYFENVPEYLWNYYIGDYKVLYKWLSYRRDRIYTFSEINHIQKVIRALDETISIKDEIDQVYKKLDFK